MSRFQCEIPGPAVPQGSAKAFVVSGKAIITSANKNLKNWRALAVLCLSQRRQEMGMEGPFEGPVWVEVVEYRVRPKGRPRRHTAPDVRPDLDKVVRASLDVLTIAGVLKDDCQVCALVASKRYRDTAGLSVSVEQTLEAQ